MKKNFFVLLAIFLVVACVGCSNTNPNPTNSDYSSEIVSSNESVSSVKSSVEDDEPHGIEGLVDVNGTPAGKKYDAIDGNGFITEFFDDGSCQPKVIKSGELKDLYDWEFIEVGIIRKTSRRDRTYYQDYFLYKDYLVDLEVDSSWGKLEGDSEMGFTNNQHGDDERKLNKDGTYSFYFFGDYKGMYTMLEERIMRVDYTDKWGDSYTYYLFINNDNCIHIAYQNVD